MSNEEITYAAVSIPIKLNITVQVLFAACKKVKGNRVRIPSDPVTVSGYADAQAIAER